MSKEKITNKSREHKREEGSTQNGDTLQQIWAARQERAARGGADMPIDA